MDAAGGPERMEYNGSQDYELFLRLTETGPEDRPHPPRPLLLAFQPRQHGQRHLRQDLLHRRGHCRPQGSLRPLRRGRGRCVSHPGTPGYYKTDYATIDHPGRVSILIPHLRSHPRLGDLRGVHLRPAPPTRILRSSSSRTTARPPKPSAPISGCRRSTPDNLKVVTWEGKGFNYSALNNFGEKFATGEYLLLLNNDTEVITAAWLEEMVMYAQQKRVGLRGAKLLYPDDTIQHAGVGFGIGGVAGHLHKYYPASSDGYMGRLNYVQDVYADTAACLLIRKEIYDEVGGLDESHAVAFNDVDFCVRVRQAGYTNVFTPFAQLYHYESKSRGMEDNPEKQKRFQGEVLRFQARWGDLLAAGDPPHQPQLRHPARRFQPEDITAGINKKRTTSQSRFARQLP